VSNQPHRLAEGGRIDRSRRLSFRFDGQTLDGHPGDTLASALLANGVRLMGRSFKYHRPRGVLTAGTAEPNALVELGSGARRTPNVRATMAELHEGLEATSQNRWPSLTFDLRAVNGLFKPLFVAGFYYKTFMWPARFWEAVYEPLIRRSAGLGRASGLPDPDRYAHAHLHADVLVVGAGPAGLAAALAAGRAGARVLLCDEDFEPGGSLLGERTALDGEAAATWVAATVAELRRLDNVRLLARTAVFGYYDHNTLGAVQQLRDHLDAPAAETPRERLWTLEAGRVILATGAHERPIAFAGNDRPGVMLASAARAYVNRFAVRPGTRAVVFGNNDDIQTTADDLEAAGIDIAAVLDARPPAAERGLSRPVRHARIAAVLGRLGVRGVRLDDGTRLACDLICVAGGWNPAVHLSSQTGTRPVWDAGKSCFVPGPPRQAETSVGAARGRFGTDMALLDGASAGMAAAEAGGFKAQMPELPQVAEPPRGHLVPVWYVPGREKTAFVDPQNDVTVADVKLAAREGYGNVEHMKRYTTLGMATDQGKIANVTGLAILAEARGAAIPDVGTTTFRPPYTPVSIGALAGYRRQRIFHPTRRTPLHAWQADRGAVFVEAGAWLRARYFPRDGEDMTRAASREARTVRGAVGICDVSTLGRIDIQGPDAAELLNRVYINGWRTLPVGKARYGVMLREDGMVLDDGTTSRLGETHYLMTATTANAGAVMSHLEHALQVLWPNLDVQVSSVTEQWAGLAVAGPQARALLQRVLPAADLSNAGFPFMAAGTFTLQGIQVRLFRISFSGELGYELNVPADYGPAVAALLLHHGRDLGADLYGLEALDMLRIEKGHVTGAELDGRVTAADLGMGRMMSTKKDFIGRHLARRPALTDPARPRLVGLKAVDPRQRIRAGAHLLAEGAATTIDNDEGYVSSATYSPTLDAQIALAFLARGAERHGDIVRAVDPVRDGEVPVEVCAPVFVDPKGERQRG